MNASQQKDSKEEKGSISDLQDSIVEDFLSIGDPLSQYEYLLEFAAMLPAFPETFKNDSNRVKGCQSQAWLVLDDDGERLSIMATSDALIVRGVLMLLIEVVDGQPLSEIADSTIDFPSRSGILSTFSNARRQGIASILETLKTYAKQAQKR